MSKKTVKIEALKDRANFFFHFSGDAYRERRLALQSFVEGFLHDTGSYKGFRYLTATDVPGKTPGIIFDADGKGKHRYPDSSRISFY